MNSEEHLFVIWEKGRVKEKEILDDIASRFEIVSKKCITWSKDKFAENLTHFYAENLPSSSDKIKECGSGEFLLIVVRDNHPLYCSRKTSKGVKRVNVNIFDAKELYRFWTGGGAKIYATDSVADVNSDLALLLGMNAHDFEKNNTIDLSENSKEPRNSVGACFWDSFKDFFYVLKNCLMNFFKNIFKCGKRICVEIICKLIAIRNYLNWIVKKRRFDFENVLQVFSKIDSLTPVHLYNWHYGTRYLLVTRNQQKIFVKVLSKDSLANREINFYENIVEKCGQLRGYIPNYLSSLKTKENIYMFIEHVDGKTFDSINFDNLPISLKCEICEKLFLMLKILKNAGVSHNDIRLQNFMLKNNSPVLFDFGYACYTSEKELFLASLSSLERERINNFNRIAKDVHDDAFSMFYVIKHVNPEFMVNQAKIWNELNSLMG